MTPLCFTPALTQELQGSGTPIIVTGAGGWLGRAALEMLDSALGESLADRVTVFASSPRVITLGSGRTLAARDFTELEDGTAPPSLILHFAFRTRGHAQEQNYVAANRQIAQHLRNFIQHNGARGIFIPSSGAVYGPIR